MMGVMTMKMTVMLPQSIGLMKSCVSCSGLCAPDVCVAAVESV